LNGPH